MPSIVPCLWFDGQAEQAAELYTKIFPNSEILAVARYGPDGPGPDDAVMTVEFSLDGQRFLGLNGGPQFPFTEAVSFQIYVEDQAELDFYWNALSEGGKEVECGWLQDRFGLSWQVVPTLVTELVQAGDDARTQRAMKALWGMTKLDIAEIRRAADAG